MEPSRLGKDVDAEVRRQGLLQKKCLAWKRIDGYVFQVYSVEKSHGMLKHLLVTNIMTWIAARQPGLLQRNIVDMYSKCGMSHKARETVKKLLMCDIVSCTSLLLGYESQVK